MCWIHFPVPEIIVLWIWWIRSNRKNEGKCSKNIYLLLTTSLIRQQKRKSLSRVWLWPPWNSPGQNTGVGSLSLLQGIFPTQQLNPDLLHCRQILYQLSHKGSQALVYIHVNCFMQMYCTVLRTFRGRSYYPHSIVEEAKVNPQFWSLVLEWGWLVSWSAEGFEGRTPLAIQGLRLRRGSRS